MSEKRIRRIEEETCLIGGERFMVDWDLVERVSENSTQILGKGRVRNIPQILKFPEEFYHLCPKHRFERYGYRNIYEAIAYLLFEAKRSHYKKIKLRKDHLKAIGLDKTDLHEIQKLEKRYQGWRD
jgi:hypothetical protein